MVACKCTREGYWAPREPEDHKRKESRDSQINRPSYDIAVDYRAERFPRQRVLDAKIASALKKFISSVHFRRKVSVEEQRAQKYNRFLRGRQIAHMIYEYIRATGAFEAVQGLSDLFRIRLQDDGVQDVDTRWDQAPLAASEMPSETVLEGLHKSKLQDSVQRHTALAMYEQENVRNHEPPNYSRLKTKVRRHIDQTMRTCNFRARSEVVERGEVTKSQKKGEKSQRGEESWRMLSVGVNWTMFERRLMQVQSRWGIWQQLRSLAKRTIVFSCTTSEGTD